MCKRQVTKGAYDVSASSVSQLDVSTCTKRFRNFQNKSNCITLGFSMVYDDSDDNCHMLVSRSILGIKMKGDSSVGHSLYLLKVLNLIYSLLTDRQTMLFNFRFLCSIIYIRIKQRPQSRTAISSLILRKSWQIIAV